MGHRDLPAPGKRAVDLTRSDGIEGTNPATSLDLVLFDDQVVKATHDSEAFLSGVLQRLRNLAHGLDDHTLSPRERTKAALTSYRNDLGVDRLTAALRRALRDDHRS